MSTYNICFHGEIKKNINIFVRKKAPYLALSREIQEGQLSVSGERMCTILVNC